MTDYYFCTYFDRHYCEKGLVLYESLKKHVKSFRLIILCLDEETFSILDQLLLPEVTLLRLEELESRDLNLKAIRNTRSLIEYYFTCTPAFILDIISLYPYIDIITYLDADLYLFSSIDPAYEEMGNNSILIIEHRFSPELLHIIKFGRFNVGYLSFRNDLIGLQCLHWWRERCIEWCYDRLDGERYADQKYLDHWPDMYPHVCILQNKGIGTAPWNLAGYLVRKEKSNRYFVDENPLVLYHFAQIHEIGHLGPLILFDTYLRKSRVTYRQKADVIQSIYKDYLFQILENRERIAIISRGKVLQGKSIRSNGKSQNSPIQILIRIRSLILIVFLWIPAILLIKDGIIMREKTR